MVLRKSLVVAMVVCLAGCSKVNIENFEKIEIGMDKAEVETILGGADSCVEKTLHSECVWGSDSKNIKVTFVSNKVTLYSNHGFAK